MIAQFKDVPGRGLTAFVRDHPWETPADLPARGSLIELNGLTYEVRGTECGVGTGRRIVGGVNILVRIRGGEGGAQGT